MRDFSLEMTSTGGKRIKITATAIQSLGPSGGGRELNGQVKRRVNRLPWQRDSIENQEEVVDVLSSPVV